MRPEPALTPDAHADILQAADYYNTQRPGLGFDFGVGELFDGPTIAASLELTPAAALPLVYTLRVLVWNEKVHRAGTFG